MFFVLLNIFIIFDVINSKRLIPLPKTLQEPLFDCLNELIVNNMERYETFHVLYTKDINFAITDQPSFTFYGNDTNTIDLNYNNFIVILNDLCEIDEFLSKFRTQNNTRWKNERMPRGKYFIIRLNNTINLVDIFKRLWSYDINKIEVFVKEFTTRIVRSNPFKRINECGRHAYITSNVTCNVTFNNHEKYPTEIENCSLNAHVITYFYRVPYVSPDIKQGITLYPLQLLEDKYKPIINWNVVKKIYKQSDLLNGMPQTLIDFMYDRKFVNGNVFLAIYTRYVPVYDDFETSETLFSEKLMWLLPKPRLLPRFLVIIRLFSWKIWLTAIIVIFTSSVLWTTISITKEERHSEDKFRSCLNVLSMLFGWLQKQPKSKILKTFTIFFFFFSFHMNYFFQGQLSSCLTIPLYESRVRNVEQLLQSDAQPFMQMYIAKFWKDSPNKVIADIVKKAIISDEFKGTILETISNFSYAMPIRKSNVILLEAEMENLQHFLDESTYSLDVTQLHQKGDPLLPTINHIICQIRESGLNKKILNDMRNFTFVRSDKEEHIVLSFSHVQAAFYELFIGLIIATSIFLIEIMRYKLYAK